MALLVKVFYRHYLHFYSVSIVQYQMELRFLYRIEAIIGLNLPPTVHRERATFEANTHWWPGHFLFGFFSVLKPNRLSDSFNFISPAWTVANKNVKVRSIQRIKSFLIFSLKFFIGSALFKSWFKFWLKIEKAKLKNETNLKKQLQNKS